MIKLSEILDDVYVKNKKTGKKYDVKKFDSNKYDWAYDYRGSKQNPNPFTKKKQVKEDTINESFDVVDALILSLVQGGLGLGIGALGSYMISGGLVGKIKDWWKKHKDNDDVKKVVNKLKSDSEVKSAMKNPKEKDIKGVIKKKLRSSELNNLKSLS